MATVCRYGCCSDGETEKMTAGGSGCPVTEPPLLGGCGGTKYGCCADGLTGRSDMMGVNCDSTLNKDTTAFESDPEDLDMASVHPDTMIWIISVVGLVVAAVVIVVVALYVSPVTLVSHVSHSSIPFYLDVFTMWPD
jgi:hypothetical protein